MTSDFLFIKGQSNINKKEDIVCQRKADEMQLFFSAENSQSKHTHKERKEERRLILRKMKMDYDSTRDYNCKYCFLYENNGRND